MAHSILDTSVEFMDIYNNTYVKFKSYTDKGIKDIIVMFYDKTDNAEQNIYSHHVLTQKINDSIDSLDRIQKGHGLLP